MLIYSQCKYLNCLMPYPYMWKQYGSVNEMHSTENENYKHIIVLAYLTINVDSLNMSTDRRTNFYCMSYGVIFAKSVIHFALRLHFSQPSLTLLVSALNALKL